jgi:hypothetical protein
LARANVEEETVKWSLRKLPLSRIRRASVVLAVAMLAAVTVAAPAYADPKIPKPPATQPQGAIPGGFVSWDEVYAFQTRLHAAAERILAAGGAGNASLVTGLDKHELRVYWNGEVPASVRKLAGGLDVPVVFLPAQFTHRELVNEAQRLTSDKRVIEAAPKADGSGLAVTVTDQLRQTDQAGLQATARVPLAITAGKQPQQVFNRQADTPLFWGGSRYNTPIGGCSNGFAIQAPSDANIVMISAGHCGNDLDAANIPGQGTPTGVVHVKNGCRDTLLIFYPAGVAPNIYTGAFDSSTNATISAATFDIVGDLIDTGGASSGEHFNVPVQAVDVFTAVGGNPCASVGPLTRAGYLSATCAVAPGDSGGPVYTRTGANAVARGTITAGNLGSANCPGVVTTGGNTVWYAPLVRPAGDPQIGSLAFYNSTIMCPGCGPAQVAVPNLVGLTESAALDALGAAGLRQGLVTDVIDNSCNNLGIVSNQSPSPGTLVNPGTNVNYGVFRQPPPPAQCP